MGEPYRPTSRDAEQPKHPRRGLLPPELIDVLTPALKVGALAGGAGAVSGVAAGIIRDAPPVLFGLVSSIQWFALGSSYWLSRSVISRSWGGERSLSMNDKIKASALAGGTAGMVGGLLRGPRNIVPGAIVFTIFGAAGQGIANKLTQWKTAEEGAEGSNWLRSKYSPLRKLTDEEYEAFIGEKMLKIEAEIALIDDKISELRAEAVAKTEIENDIESLRPSLSADPEQSATSNSNMAPQAKSWWKRW
ncbi:hypothetical protein jhhlp_000048 [Lomentospora prolificans]|uniref:Uncharacterized protein n=1 Tax=Lomentospora prolificans TaxID=41688 RepID=A0A2N3NLG9_9PEZI|nr:hypothetical protein jhhlp_000048 [Lomentospora prolificans]